MDWRPHTCWFLFLFVASGFSQTRQFVANGGFENGFNAWQTAGDFHLETNSPLEGKASMEIGPGAGSLTQRMEIGSGNDFTLSAIIQPQRTKGWVLAARFLDQNGREVMRVDSLTDLERDKKEQIVKIRQRLKLKPFKRNKLRAKYVGGKMVFPQPDD